MNKKRKIFDQRFRTMCKQTDTDHAAFVLLDGAVCHVGGDPVAAEFVRSCIAVAMAEREKQAHKRKPWWRRMLRRGGRR